jgi:hypothetical protein
MKNIFILLLSVITMSMFTFASCEGDEPQPQETGFDTFRYEVTGSGDFVIYYKDSVGSIKTALCSDGDGDYLTQGVTNWVYEWKEAKPYTFVQVSLSGGDECKIYMNGELLDIVPNGNGQLIKTIKGSLFPTSTPLQ